MIFLIAAEDSKDEPEVRWRPGCGNYSILKTVQKTMADIGASKLRSRMYFYHEHGRLLP